jgi:hypothetical protein
MRKVCRSGKIRRWHRLQCLFGQEAAQNVVNPPVIGASPGKIGSLRKLGVAVFAKHNSQLIAFDSPFYHSPGGTIRPLPLWLSIAFTRATETRAK